MIHVANMKKIFGGHEVLRDVSLEVGRGDVAVIIGASGSGKSTFLRCLNGLEPFDGGAVTIGGVTVTSAMAPREVAEAMKRVRRRMGMVFQQFNLFPHLSVLQNVTEAPIHVAGLDPEEARDKAMSLLERVGVASKAAERPHRLSGGQQQRVAIARALAMDPEVILFDEPTSALDPKMTEEVLSVMTDLAEGGQTMVIVTHAMSFARRAATTVHVFGEGRVLESGPPDEVLRDESAADGLVREAPRSLMREGGRPRPRRAHRR